MDDRRDRQMAPGDDGPPGEPTVGEQVCPECSGSGRVDDASCRHCGGTGRVYEAIGGG